MSRIIDVLVAGSGLAGLFAAYAAAKNGARVRVVSMGMGSLAISGGSIDLLGYDPAGKLLENPFAGLDKLAADHPYSLLGVDNVKAALTELTSLLAARKLKLKQAGTEEAAKNFMLPTIFGTLRPTLYYQGNVEAEQVNSAKKILVLSVKGFRDCRPALIISQLRRYPAWADREYVPVVLPAPFNEKGRSLNALDLAHLFERPQGREWMQKTMKGLGAGHDLVLMPPMLGISANSEVRDIAAQILGCPVLEMASIPPGVAGLRIRHALMQALHELNVEFFENAEIKHAEVGNRLCTAVVSHSTGRDITSRAKTVIVATGGIMAGGIVLGPGKAREHIFAIDIPVPANVDEWSEKGIFEKHLFSCLGVKVNSEMRPVGQDGALLLENVFFAGRSIGGYDFAAEKSGHGVAAATAWRAGCLAAAQALGQNGQV